MILAPPPPAPPTKRELESEKIAKFSRVFLKHVEGPLGGKPLELDEWQLDKFIRPLFDTLKPDGRRQFKRALLFLPRKNGKTTLIVVVALYLLFADKREYGAHIVVAARDTDQAMELFKLAKKMVRKSRELKRRCDIFTDKIVAHRGAEFSVIAADDLGNLGPNHSCIIIDELLAQKNRNLYDALISGQIARSEPLFIMISTAGKVAKSLLYEKYLYAQQILSGVVDDPTFLPVIFEAPSGRDWRDEETWKLANPALGGNGAGFILENLRDRCREAQASLSEELAFKQFHLNIFCFEGANKYIGAAVWAKCFDLLRPKLTDAQLARLPCWGGLDLSISEDLASFALIWALGGEAFAVRVWSWTAEKCVNDRIQKGQAPFGTYVDRGELEVIKGEVIDYDHIQRAVTKICRAFSPKGIGYDPFNALYMAQRLECEGYSMRKFPQGFGAMGPPTKDFESDAIKERIIDLDGNKLLAWAIDNVELKTSAYGDRRPHKLLSMDKIDPCVAVLMGYGMAREGVAKNPTGGVSPYESNGVRFL